MRSNVLSIASFFVALFMFDYLPILSAGESRPYAPQVPVKAYYFCTALEPSREMPDESMSQGKIYYSGIIMTENPNLGPISLGFVKFLQQKYTYKMDERYDFQSSIQCYQGRTQQEAETQQQNYLKRSKKTPTNAVIETGWTPSNS